MFKVTDDFKIMTNRAIVAIKDKNEKDFICAIRYILKECQYREQEEYAKYLFRKMREVLDVMENN